MKKITAVFLVILFALNIGIKADALSAKAAVVINGDTGEVLFSKNADIRLPMASTTKIMTALLLCENAGLDETIVTTKEMVTVEGSSMGLTVGDTVSYHDLLYGMMLASPWTVLKRTPKLRLKLKSSKLFRNFYYRQTV